MLGGWIRWLVPMLLWLPIETLSAGFKLALKYEPGDAYAVQLEQALSRLPDIQLVEAAQAEVLVSVGARQFLQQLQQSSRPLIATQISNEALQLILDKTGHQLDPQQMLVVLRDPPLLRQLQLLKLLLPKARRVGFLCTEPCPSLPANSLSLEWVKQSVKPETLTAELARLLPKVDVLLAYENRQIYNPQSLQALLLTSYRHRKLVIGPSVPYVNAGSLATTYSDAEDVARYIAQALAHYRRKRTWPVQASNPFFHVAINSQVATSLGLQLPDPELVQQRMLQERPDGN